MMAPHAHAAVRPLIRRNASAPQHLELAPMLPVPGRLNDFFFGQR
jgi:hypothetical protein